MAVKDYNTDADLNTTISGINIAEGCPPSGINNAIRQLMADVKAEKDARDQAQTALTARDAAQDKAISDEVAARERAVSALNESIDNEVAARESAVSALDAAVVHKSGAETIAGAKTFSTTPIVKGNSPALYLNEDTFEKGVLPTTNQHWGIVFNDKNNSMHGRVQHYVNSNGQTATTLTTTSVDGSVSGTLGVVVRANGTVEGYCPSTPANSTGNQIVTADFLQKDQTMAGAKTFTGKVAQEGAKTIHSYKNTDVTKGTAPASNKYWDVEFADKNGDGTPANRIGTLTVSLTPNNLASTVLRAYKPEAGSSASAILAVQYPASGTPYATAPTPDATSNTTHIATTAWVRGKGVLVESWHSGANWYRKYSDGWIEQGGFVSTTTSRKNQLVNLQIAFTTTDYTVMFTGHDYSHTDSNYAASTGVMSKTTTSFKMLQVTERTSNVWNNHTWYACGY